MLDINQVERMLKGFDENHFDDDDDDDELDDHDLGDLESELDSIVNAGGSKSASTAASSNQQNYFTEPPAPQYSTVPLKPTVIANSAPAPPARAPVYIPQPDYNTAPSIPSRETPKTPQLPQTSNSNAQKIAQIKQLQIEYKRAALKAKNDQDKNAALAHFKVSKVSVLGLFFITTNDNYLFH